MKKIYTTLLATSLLLASTQASAAAFNINNLAANLGTQANFETLSNDLSAAIWMNPSNSAEPHSAGLIPVGFQVGVETTSLKLNSTIWKSLGSPSNNILIPKLRVSAGIPFGLDVSAMYTAIPSSNIKITGYEARLAFGEFIPLPMIEFNVRAYQSKLSGVAELSVKDTGFAAMLGADFPIIKPYIEIGQVRSTSTPSGAAAVAFQEYSKTTTTTAIGAKLSIFPFVVINGEYATVNKRALYTLKLAGEF